MTYCVKILPNWRIIWERDDELMTTIKAHEMKIQLTTKKVFQIILLL